MYVEPVSRDGSSDADKTDVGRLRWRPSAATEIGTDPAIATILTFGRGLVLRTSCDTGYPVARILIVDDEPDIRFMMRLIFEDAGHTVTEARHGAMGLKSIRASRPDLVTTDVMMPTMDGLEFIERLRADPETAAIPILAVSGNAELATAADARLSKPFLPRELLGAATRLIRKGSLK
jgi:CheY-like chemotaxis protein